MKPQPQRYENTSPPQTVPTCRDTLWKLVCPPGHFKYFGCGLEFSDTQRNLSLKQLGTLLTHLPAHPSHRTLPQKLLVTSQSPCEGSSPMQLATAQFLSLHTSEHMGPKNRSQPLSLEGVKWDILSPTPRQNSPSATVGGASHYRVVCWAQIHLL